jgi:hypothetical protein
MKPDFTWSSPLGISTALFITIGVVYILIGAIGIVIIEKVGSGNFASQYYLGKKVDEMIFGKPVSEVNLETPHIGKYISMLMIVFCSFMVALGILQVAVAEYALTEGQRWAYWSLILSSSFMLAIYWFAVIIPVMKQYGVGYLSLWHPYAFIPTILLPAAAVLGWMGLRN